MAVPRPLLLTLLGTVLLAATFLVTRNAREQAAEEPTPPAQQAAAPETAPKPAEKSKPRADKAQATGNDTRKAAPSKERTDKPANRPDKGAAAKRPVRPGMVAAVRRAVRSNRTVVLFFFQRGASDDRRVAASLKSLRGSKAVVFKDRIGNLARYGQLATSAGVTRAPSIVIIGKGRRGRLIEGYVDANTLAQRVADAR
jgi:hypothetical protein